jgi:hypothetical protein
MKAMIWIEAARAFCRAEQELSRVRKLGAERCLHRRPMEPETGYFDPGCDLENEADRQFWCEPCVRRKENTPAFFAALRRRALAKKRMMRAWNRETLGPSPEVLDNLPEGP